MNNAIRRTITDIADTLERLIKTPIISLMRLLRCLGRPNQVVNPTPCALVGKICTKAKLEAVSYGPDEPRVCPQYFEVTVPQGSWEEFYKHDTAQICADIADRVYQRICESETVTIGRVPTIDIACDTRPGHEGAVVTAHFYDARCGTARAEHGAAGRAGSAGAANGAGGPEAVAIEAADPAPGPADGPAAQASPAAPAPEPADGHASTGLAPSGPVSSGPALSETILLPHAGEAARQGLEAGRGHHGPAAAAPQALLAGKTGSYLVHDGDVIGVVRGAGPIQPSVCLPLDAFPFASREHARLSFDQDANTWQLEQLGRHGSCILRAGERIELSPGGTLALAAGDVIEIPRANDKLTFSDEPLAGTTRFAP